MVNVIVASGMDYPDARVGMVFIMGGTGAVPASMETELAEAGIDGSRVVRFAGSDRFDTNLKMMDYTGVGGVFMVCSGKDYVDPACARLRRILADLR